MIAAIQFKLCMAGACILGVVISELGHWQEPCPIVLFEIDKSSKVGLYGAILLFCLAVGLRVEGGRELSLDSEEITE